MAGKWWGDLDQKPIICLHGWQDNAGSFDRLIPLLPKDYSYLAIDFLGHGRSSWIAKGVPYNVNDNIYSIIYVMKEYNWDKISLIGHSMGGCIAYLFAILFPHKTEKLITIEFGKTPDRTAAYHNIDSGEKILKFIERDLSGKFISEPPSYTIQEMIEKFYEATLGNVTKESAPYIIERNIERSEKNPDKFYFSRDPQLRNMIINVHPENLTLQGAKDMKIPFLMIISDKSPLFAKDRYFERLLEACSENSFFIFKVIESAQHHFHLNEPEIVSQLISSFLKHNNDKITAHL